MSGSRMVLLTRARSEFAARVLVAKLGSAGILAEIRGLSAVYPIMGSADVWVEAEEYVDARDLIAAELDDVLPIDPADVAGPPAAVGHPAPIAAMATGLRLLLIAVSLVVLASFALTLTRCSPAPTMRTR